MFLFLIKFKILLREDFDEILDVLPAEIQTKVTSCLLEEFITTGGTVFRIGSEYLLHPLVLQLLDRGICDISYRANGTTYTATLKDGEIILSQQA